MSIADINKVKETGNGRCVCDFHREKRKSFLAKTRLKTELFEISQQK